MGSKADRHGSQLIELHRRFAASEPLIPMREEDPRQDSRSKDEGQEEQRDPKEWPQRQRWQQHRATLAGEEE